MAGPSFVAVRRTLAATEIPYGSAVSSTYSLLTPSRFAIIAPAAPCTSSAATTRAKAPAVGGFGRSGYGRDMGHANLDA
jgi:hypothetical protein